MHGFEENRALTTLDFIKLFTMSGLINAKREDLAPF